MNLEQAIHQRWADRPSLDALLPAGRLRTGRSLSTPPPYATLWREKTQTLCRTNDGRIDEIGFRINLWHDDYSKARAVAGQIDAVFDGCTLALAGSQQLLSFRRTGWSEHQHDDSLWQFEIRFSARIFLPVPEP